MVWQRTGSRAFSALLCSAVLALAGCGGMTAPTPIAGTAGGANLNGNWLLNGALPFDDLSGSVTNTQFGVAGTFSVIGSNVVAGLSANIPCGTFVLSEAIGVLTGTIASDGSFSLQSVSNGSSAAVTLSGTVPGSSTAGWSGKLTVSLTNGVCPFSQQVNFTAAKIADITGTYSGSGTMTFASGSPAPQAVSYQFALQQGTALGNAGAESAEVLTGTVKVQGSSCFSSGTITAPTGGGVLGSELVVTITMNDGSSLSGVGQIMDTGALQLDMSELLGGGGLCGLYLVPQLTLSR